MDNYSRALELVERLEGALDKAPTLSSASRELLRDCAMIRAQLALVDAAGGVAGGALPAPIVVQGVCACPGPV